MYSFVLRFVLGVFSVTGLARTARVFNEPKETRDERLLSFFWFFFFLALHQFAWSVPFTFFKNRDSMAFWSYEAAMVFYFLMLYFGIRTLFYLFPKNKFLNKRLFGNLALLSGLAVIVSEFFTFNPPIIDGNFVVWQTNYFSSWISGLFGFLTAVAWTLMLYKNMPQDSKTSATFLFLGALFLGLSCLVFFIFKTPIAFITAFTLIILGLACGLTSFYWPKKEKINQ